MRILILLLFLFSCAEEEIKKPCPCKTCFKMTISDSTPIQFWVNGVETYNQKQICGVYRACFCQPFECDDEIRIQFQEPTGSVFELLIQDENEEEITTLDFTEVEDGVYEISFIPSGISPQICNANVSFQIIGQMIDADFSEDLDGWTNEGGTEEFLNGELDGSIANWTDEGGGDWTDTPWAYNGGLSAARIQLTTPGVQGAGTFETDELGHVYVKSNLQVRDFNFSVRWDDNISSGSLSALDLYCRYFKAGVQQGADDQLKSILVPSGATITDSFTTATGDFDEIRFFFRGTNSAGFEAQMAFSIISMVPDLVTLNDWYYDGTALSASTTAPFVWDSKYLVKAVAPITEPFTITISYVRDTGDSNARLVLYLSDGVVRQEVVISDVGEGTGPYTKDIEITPSITYDRLELKAFLTEEQFFVFSLFTENEILGQSDCIDIRESHECTELLEYTNSTNFDGIIYTISPQPTFYLRIPAQFWKENNPMTQEDSELSNGVIVTRRQSIQEKILLEIGYVPNWLHKKIQKVLMHETVSVSGQTVKRRDEYEAENIDRYPLKRGNVWLTKYDSVEKNTI